MPVRVPVLAPVSTRSGIQSSTGVGGGGGGRGARQKPTGDGQGDQ